MKKKPKQVKLKVVKVPAHFHKFVVERCGFSDITKEVEYLDMRCECGLPLFCMKPTTHIGDGPNRLLKASEV